MFVVQGSARPNGNTELLTNKLLAGIDAETVTLREKEVLPIADQRHDVTGFSDVEDDFAEIVARMLEHEQILLATPLYWYGMSGHLKNFIDRWSQAIRMPGLDFKERMKGKKIYVVVVGGPAARVKGLPLIQQFQLICNFLELEFVDYVIGEAVKPGEVVNDQVGLSQAEALNRKLTH